MGILIQFTVNASWDVNANSVLTTKCVNEAIH